MPVKIFLPDPTMSTQPLEQKCMAVLCSASVKLIPACLQGYFKTSQCYFS